MIGSRRVLIFLAKAVVLFLGFMWLWGGDRPGWYHTVIAGFLNAALPAFDPTGVIDGAHANGRTLMVRLGIDDRMVGLSINLSDITSNMGLMWTLYLASFDNRRPQTGTAVAGTHLLGSTVFLFLCHVVTAATFTFEALMSHPLVMRDAPFSSAELNLIPRFNIFYEELGAVLLVLLLWLPYAMLVLRESRPRRRAAGGSKDAAT